MGESGTIAFAGETREAVACSLAGALAEAGVTRLEVSDPRACRTYELRAGKSDLPRSLLDMAPGTTLGGEGVALLVDAAEIRWVADAGLAGSLRSIPSG
jgi:hypothetical protein